MKYNYEAVYGFNSKQWWVYDNDKDVYIDVPTDVLNELQEHSNDICEQQCYFEDYILVNVPKWLEDKDHWYDDVEI